jgi:hypothetical protein
MVSIAWPINTAPGKNAQDGAGRLINVFPEVRQNGQGLVWRRAPGATVFTTIYPSTASMPVTVTAAFVGTWDGGINGGDIAATGTVTPSFVGSST